MRALAVALLLVTSVIAGGCTPGTATGQATPTPGATPSASASSPSGQEATVSVTQPGVPALFTFSATAGQKIFVDVSSTLPDECGVLTLRGPDDAVLASGCIIGGKGYIDGTILPAAGRYAIVVQSALGKTGEARLRVITDTDQVGTFALDGPAVTARIAEPGAVARLTFSDTAGAKVFVDVVSTSLPDECGVVTLRGPNAAALASGCVIGGSGYIDGTVLPATGQYTIVLDPAERTTGGAQLRLIADHDQLGSIAVDGTEVTATIAQPGAATRFTFSGTAGQKVFVEVLSSDLPDECGVVTLRGADNAFVASGCIIGGKGSIDGAILPATGQYTIVVDPTDRRTGEARLRLHL